MHFLMLQKIGSELLVVLELCARELHLIVVINFQFVSVVQCLLLQQYQVLLEGLRVVFEERLAEHLT